MPVAKTRLPAAAPAPFWDADIPSDVPDPLRPFSFHGLLLDLRRGGREAVADCPFCDREGKLYINSETGQFHCKTCDEEGNAYSFMRKLWEVSQKETGRRIDDLAEVRSLSAAGLEAWGICSCRLNQEWIVPGYDAAGKVVQVYKYEFNSREQRYFLNMAKGTHHQLHGVNLFDHSKRDVYICEGIWDGIALWETLRSLKKVEEGGTFQYAPTSNEALSLLADANVIAVPSATTFSEYWAPLFAGKRVFLLYDNDHPDKQGRIGALEGMKRVVQVLMGPVDHPEEVQYLHWGSAGSAGESGKDFDPELKHGFDLRDLLTGGDQEDRVNGLDWMFSKCEPVPAEWVAGAKQKGKPLTEPVKCETWEELVAIYRKALSFHEGLDRGLSVVLATAASVDIGLDQLWLKLVGPPSSGKTTIVDGLVIARKYATLKSVVSGIHSGYKSGDGDDEDYSLMATMKGKAVVIKDGDTLLQADNRDKTLADLRDAYDRKSSTHFKNGINRDYEDHSFVIILCGTEGLRFLDTSELGQRMIDCVVMDGIDEKVETGMLNHKKSRIRGIMGNQSSQNGDGVDGKDLTLAKRMTAGYLIYLRQNIKYLIENVKVTDATLDRIEGFARLVSVFRARPSKLQHETESRELAGRLFDQFSKLAYCLAVVMNRKEIDKEVLRRVQQTAFDTARGKTLEIARYISKAGPKGIDLPSLGLRVSMDTRDLRKLLIFMKRINILEPFAKTGRVGFGSASNRWRLTSHAKKLYNSILK